MDGSREFGAKCEPVAAFATRSTFTELDVDSPGAIVDDAKRGPYVSLARVFQGEWQENRSKLCVACCVVHCKLQVAIHAVAASRFFSPPHFLCVALIMRICECVAALPSVRSRLASHRAAITPTGVCFLLWLQFLNQLQFRAAPSTKGKQERVRRKQ